MSSAVAQGGDFVYVRKGVCHPPALKDGTLRVYKDGKPLPRWTKSEMERIIGTGVTVDVDYDHEKRKHAQGIFGRARLYVTNDFRIGCVVAFFGTTKEQQTVVSMVRRGLLNGLSLTYGCTLGPSGRVLGVTSVARLAVCPVGQHRAAFILPADGENQELKIYSDDVMKAITPDQTDHLTTLLGSKERAQALVAKFERLATMADNTAAVEGANQQAMMDAMQAQAENQKLAQEVEKLRKEKAIADEANKTLKVKNETLKVENESMKTSLESHESLERERFMQETGARFVNSLKGKKGRDGKEFTAEEVNDAMLKMYDATKAEQFQPVRELMVMASTTLASGSANAGPAPIPGSKRVLPAGPSSSIQSHRVPPAPFRTTVGEMTVDSGNLATDPSVAVPDDVKAYLATL